MTETLVIKLGDYVEDPYDVLGRQGWGYKNTMSPQEVWESARGPWKAKAARVLACETVIVVNKEKEVVAVAELTGVEKIKTQDRIALIGKVNPDHKLMGTHVVGEMKSQNPISYIESVEEENLFQS